MYQFFIHHNVFLPDAVALCLFFWLLCGDKGGYIGDLSCVE